MFRPNPSSWPLLPAVRRHSAGGATLAALVLWAICAGSAFGASGADPSARVTLQLKWLHQFQFAGYYAAQAKGFYRDEGLEVTINEGGLDRQVLAKVLSGDAQFGIGDSDLLTSRINGRPLVAMAAIFQHSPYVIMSRKDRNIRKLSDLVGAKVMMSEDQGAIQLRAMLKNNGIDPKLVNILPQTWRLEDLIDGKVDAMSAYATAEPAQLSARGVTPATIKSADYGVDFYGDILFTTESEVEKAPGHAAGFLRASRKGWDYAMRHEDEIVGLILGMDGVTQRGLTRETLLREAREMRPFMLPDVVEIGHMNAARFEVIAQTLANLGLVRTDYSLDGWMYEPSPGIDPGLLRWMSGIGLAVIAIAALVLAWNMQIRRRVLVRTQELQAEVTHRAEVQQKLKVSQELFQLMFGTAASGLVMNTPDGRLLMANPTYCATLGYTEAELRTMDTRELTHPQDRARYDALRDRMLAGEFDSFTDEKCYLKKGGAAVWVRSTVSLVRSADRRPTHIIAVTEDITARRATEEKLRLLETAVSRQNDIVLITEAEPIDEPGPRIVFVNDAFERRTGYRREEVIGQSPRILQGPNTQRAELDRIRCAMEEWRPIRAELINYTKTGEEFWLEIDIVPIADEKGGFTHWVAIERDISERKRAQDEILRLNADLEERVHQRTAELETVNKELEAFSYSVSHDLRTPLNTIDGFSHLLERMVGDRVGEKEKHYLNRIRAGTRQMGELIDGLLSLAKLSRDPLRLKEVDLAAIARRVEQECREREPERVVQVHIQDGLRAYGDPLLLSVVIHNLLGNAWKFTSKQAVARIEIGCEVAVDGATVYFVKDNGAGFDMAYADKLFDTFQRLHSFADFSGTGIGLATVHRIITKHGGRVWAHAVEGQGAEFYFTLG